MNSSQFMDKQIMGLQGSHQNNDIFELLKNPSEEQNGSKKDEIIPSYDFQPIRPLGPSQSLNLDNTRPWSSANYGSIDPSEQEISAKERDRDAYDVSTVSEIDRTMKKHADNLLHALEGVSARLTQLESRTRHLESSVDELKVQVGNNYGSNDGKLRQLEIVLREVQTGIQVVRDKQEIADAHFQLAKLQVSKSDQPTENASTRQADALQAAIPHPQQPLQPPPQPSHLPGLPPQNSPLPPTLQQQNQPPVPQLQQEPYFPPPVQQPEASHPQYPPSSQHPVPPPQHYQPPPQLSQYSQPAPQPQQQQHQPPPLGLMNPPPQPQPPLALPPPSHHHPEESSYMPPLASYLAGSRQAASLNQPSSGPPPSQQFYGPTSQMYEPSSGRPGSGQLPFSSGYGPPTGSNFSDSYAYTGSLPSYNSSVMKPPHLPASAPTGGNSYPRLPTAQIWPHANAIPTASNISSGSTSGTGNRVPVDDVVDKVTTMGFPRDVVRATVRKLTENGQSVDLNMVLDKLMNDGEIQPQKGWFGR